MRVDLAIGMSFGSFEIGPCFAVLVDVGLEQLIVRSFGLGAESRALRMEAQSSVKSPVCLFNVELLGCVDLLIDVVLGLEVDRLEGRL